jgi:hypothetical protein
MPEHNYTLNIVKQYAREDKYKIGLRVLKGIDKKEKGFLEIPIKHWDLDTMSVKPKFTELYIDTIEELNEIKARIPAYIIKLNKGEVSDEDALIEVIGRQKRLDGNLLEFAKELKPKRYSVKYVLTETKIGRILERVGALERKILKGTKYVPLTFDKLQSKSNIKKIAEVMYESELKDDSICKYMEAVDKLCSFKKDKWTPFKNNELISYKKSVTSQYALSFKEMESGLNNVDTLQDLEAYLMWLYSFCLLGLNFRDIFNIDENKVMQFVDPAKQERQTFLPYHPEVQGSGEPLHIFIYRGKLKKEDKKKAPIVRMINLHPIYEIHKMLKHIVKLTRPKYAYNGRDKLRIYNFKTRDDNYKEIKSGIDKSKLIGSTYYKKWIKILGYPITNTRATSMKAGRQAGANFDELEAQLGHVIGVSKVFPTYYSAEQKRVDTNHIFSLMKYDINQILMYTINKFKDKVKGTEYWIPRSTTKEATDWFLGSGFDLPLSLLSPEEYNEMQDLLQAQEGSSFQDEHGKIAYRKANPDKYPKRLKELIDKQHKLQYTHLHGAEAFDDWKDYISGEGIDL